LDGFFESIYKKDRYHDNLTDLRKWKKYGYLRACFVYAKEDYKCHYCNAKDSDIDVRFSVDHLTPVSQGGTEDLDNLVCCCDIDNRAKLNNPEQFEKRIKTRR
jgi:5-methylcytosine-specific restriction endonuclease McrA